MPPETADPFGANRFKVEIDGIVATSFEEVSGIEAQIDVVDYRGGDQAGGSRKLPGEAKFTNLVLKRGLTSDLSLWNWMQQTLEGEITRRSLSVVLLSDADQEAVRFNVKNAWPVRWSVSTLKAESSEVVIEILEVAHTGLLVVA